MTRDPGKSSCEQIVLNWLEEDEYWLWELRGVVESERDCEGCSKEEIMSNLVKRKLICIGKRKPLGSHGHELTEEQALQVLHMPSSWIATGTDETELYYAGLIDR